MWCNADGIDDRDSLAGFTPPLGIVAECEFDGRGFTTPAQILGEPKPADILGHIANTNDSPFCACAGLLPQDGCSTGITAFQVVARVMGNVGVLVVLISDVNPGNRNPCYACIVSNLAGGHRLEQHGEAAAVLGHLGNNPSTCSLVLKCLLVFNGQDDWFINRNYIKTVAVGARLVAHFDQGA